MAPLRTASATKAAKASAVSSTRKSTTAARVFKGKAPAAAAPATAPVEDLIGVIAPFDTVFDPLKFSENADAATMLRYREAEITHGRVSMVAALGFLVGEQVEGSPFCLFGQSVTGPAIDHFEAVPTAFWLLLVGVIGVAESTRVQKGWANPFQADGLFLLREDYQPGNLSFDPLGLTPTDEAELMDLRLKELSNGRLAMVGIAGMVVQELVNGLQVFAADEAYELGGKEGLKALEAQCAGKVDEAACAKAFDLSLEQVERAAALAKLAADGIAP